VATTIEDIFKNYILYKVHVKAIEGLGTMNNCAGETNSYQSAR
jgi:hypothetical protein